MSTWVIGFGAAIIGAFAAGAVQLWLGIRDRRSARRVAAMAVLGDIAVVQGSFGHAAVNRRWWDANFDFAPALETWTKHRGDFARAVGIFDFAEVDAFYNSLAWIHTFVRPQQPMNGAEVLMALDLVERGDDAWSVALKHVGLSVKEKDRIEEIVRPHPQFGDR